MIAHSKDHGMLWQDMQDKILHQQACSNASNAATSAHHGTVYLYQSSMYNIAATTANTLFRHG